MTITDERLDRLFAAANPVPPAEGVGLRAVDIALREGIIRGERSVRRSGRRVGRRTGAWVAGLAVAAAAVVVVAIVAVDVLVPVQQASALAPAPLTYTDPEPLDDVIRDARTALSDGDGPEQAAHVESIGWGWSIDMGSEQIEIVPQEVTTDWSVETGSTTTVVAGESSWPHDDRPEDVADSPYEPGEVISVATQNAAEFDLPQPMRALNDASEEQLRAAMGDFGGGVGASSGELANGIASVQGWWTLTDAQHATLLDMLVDAGGVTVLGRTEDRLGRPVVGLRVSGASDLHDVTLLVSRETGRIVGEEVELREPLDFIPAGVIGYTLWDVDLDDD